MNESELRALLNNLEASRLPLHNELHYFTWLVIVGLAIDLIVILKEFWDDWKEYVHAQTCGYLPTRPSVVLLAFGFLGTVLIVAGVAGESHVDVKVAKLETDIKTANDQLLGLIIKEAGDAATSAKSAHEAADATKKEADDINGELQAASKQLSEVEGQLRIQGPRWIVLANNSAKFIRHLQKFKGTRITVLMCGAGVSPIEQLGTEQRLLNLLGKPGTNRTAADWKTGYEKWLGCPSTSANGLQMTLGANATEDLKSAANALKDELLALGIAASLHIVPAEQEQFWAGMGVDSPEARAARDPTTIFLLVAPNAMVGSAKPSTNQHK